MFRSLRKILKRCGPLTLPLVVPLLTAFQLVQYRFEDSAPGLHLKPVQSVLHLISVYVYIYVYIVVIFWKDRFIEAETERYSWKTVNEDNIM